MQANDNSPLSAIVYQYEISDSTVEIQFQCPNAALLQL